MSQTWNLTNVFGGLVEGTLGQQDFIMQNVLDSSHCSPTSDILVLLIFYYYYYLLYIYFIINEV